MITVFRNKLVEFLLLVPCVFGGLWPKGNSTSLFLVFFLLSLMQQTYHKVSDERTCPAFFRSRSLLLLRHNQTTRWSGLARYIFKGHLFLFSKFCFLFLVWWLVGRRRRQVHTKHKKNHHHSSFSFIFSVLFFVNEKNFPFLLLLFETKRKLI